MTRIAEFLNVKPSHQAAAAIILAININLSQIKEKIGLKPLQLTKTSSFLKTQSPDHHALLNGILNKMSE